MTNYPDDFPHHLLDGEDGNKLSCGCYEEQCECPTCDNCGDKLNYEEECPNECEDEEE